MKPPTGDDWPICPTCGEDKHIRVDLGWDEATLDDFYCSNDACSSCKRPSEEDIFRKIFEL